MLNRSAARVREVRVDVKGYVSERTEEWIPSPKSGGLVAMLVARKMLKVFKDEQ